MIINNYKINNMNNIKYMNNINNVYIINYISIDNHTNMYNNNHNKRTKFHWCNSFVDIFSRNLTLSRIVQFISNFNNNYQ